MHHNNLIQMLAVILIIVLGIALIFALAIGVNKFIPRKFYGILSLLLWVAIAYMGYAIYASIDDPIKFNKVKKARYAQVIENLKDIRKSQLAYREVNKKFTNNWDSLIGFIETGEFVLVERRDTTYPDKAKNKLYGLSDEGGYYLEDVVIDTIGFTSVKDSLFKNTDRYKRMMNIPVEGVSDKIELEAGYIETEKSKIPVFEAKVHKDKILFDQDKNLLYQEKLTVSVDGVNGEFLKVGSMEEINTTGNWPKSYGANDE